MTKDDYDFDKQLELIAQKRKLAKLTQDIQKSTISLKQYLSELTRAHKYFTIEADEDSYREIRALIITLSRFIYRMQNEIKEYKKQRLIIMRMKNAK